MFAEYQEPSNPILAGSFAGEILIPTAPAASTDDAAIQTQINSWIAAATLPVPDANTVYVMMFPAGVDVISFGQSACGNFFGYHDEASTTSGTFGRFRYIVMPYQNCGGDIAFDSPIAVNGMTDTLGHEMSEAGTDPDVGNRPLAFGWYDMALGEEIADICADTAASFGFLNFWMQKIWSDSAGTCIAPVSGSPSIHLTISTMAPGNSVTANIAFENVDNLPINFTPQIFEIQSGTSCDLSGNGFTSVADAQLMINEALGATHAADDLNGDGQVNVVDVEIVVNSALNLGCSATLG